jgi:flagellar basal-body rod protein FlgF
MAERPGVDLTAGVINSTGRDLDVAIKGDGWIAVQAADGSEAYTRAGNLNLGAGGLLVTGGGVPVMGNGGPIALPDAEKIEIGTDGTISIRGIGQAVSTLTTLDRIKLVNPDASQLVKGADGLMHLKNGEQAEPDAAVNLVSGALEASNVNAVEAMVNMIALARQYEAQVKMMSAAKEADDLSTQLLSMT